MAEENDKKKSSTPDVKPPMRSMRKAMPAIAGGEANNYGHGSTEAEWKAWFEKHGAKGKISGTDDTDRAYPKPKGSKLTPSGRYSPNAGRVPGLGTPNNNPFITFDVSTSGIRDTLYGLTAMVTASAMAAEAALLASAKRVQARAKQNVRKHRYDGRLENAITVRVSSKSNKNFVRVTVGIHGRTFAPEGATLERGWKSEKNLQPPSEPLAEWAKRRGLATEANMAAVGFLIARAMGRRPGYSFGARPWLAPAFESERLSVEPTVARYMLSAWGARPRIPAGQPGAGRFLGVD